VVLNRVGAPTQGNVNEYPGGERLHALQQYNMKSLINKITSKYICFHSLFKVREAWNKEQLLKNHCYTQNSNHSGLGLARK